MNKLRSLITGNASFFLAVPALVWQVLLLYVPLALIVVMGFIKYDAVSTARTLTFEYIVQSFDTLHLMVVMRSLVLAFISAVICIVCAYPVAYYTAFTLRRWKHYVLFFLVLPFWVNFLVHIYAWFFVLEKHGIINSILLKIGIISVPLQLLNTSFAVCLLMIYCYLPFAVMPIYSALEKFDKRLFEASADLGATPFQTFVRVVLPISANGIRTAFFLVFVPAFGEFIIPTLMSGGKQLYVGSLITHYFLTTRDFNVGASFTLLSCAVLVIASALIYYVFKRVFGTMGDH